MTNSTVKDAYEDVIRARDAANVLLGQWNHAKLAAKPFVMGVRRHVLLAAHKSVVEISVHLCVQCATNVVDV